MRESIPKKIKDILLDEYNHKCAVCGSDRPHVHHINEDSSDSSINNLLPLCPNCHLSDQHNPTRKIDIPKLQLFRKYKDPVILKPQFHPIYTRQLFLMEVLPGYDSVEVIERQAKELIEFVGVLEMGEFYSKRLVEFIGPLNRAMIMNLGAEPDESYNRQVRSANTDYRNKIISNRENAIALLVELLRYQGWVSS
jgi:hypothetical protein